MSSALTEQQACEIFAQGEEAVVFALLQLARQLAMANGAAVAKSLDTPATPSGMKPYVIEPHAVSSQRAEHRGKCGGRDFLAAFDRVRAVHQYFGFNDWHKPRRSEEEFAIRTAILFRGRDLDALESLLDGRGTFVRRQNPLARSDQCFGDVGEVAHDFDPLEKRFGHITNTVRRCDAKMSPSQELRLGTRGTVPRRPIAQ